MAFNRDETLKAWDEALPDVENPTDGEIAAATAIVCAKCPGITHDDIAEALRTSIEDLQLEVASAERVLKSLKTIAKEREGTLPGLPGGPPLKGRQ